MIVERTCISSKLFFHGLKSFPLPESGHMARRHPIVQQAALARCSCSADVLSRQIYLK